MSKPTFDELLARSAPSFVPSFATQSALEALVLETKDASVREPLSRRRRTLLLLPGVILAGGALTAGAAAVDAFTRVDVPVAIEYTTDTGITVKCTAQIDGGSLFSPKPAEAIDYYRTHDFAGVGQRIYEYALILAGDKQGVPDALPESGWLPGEDFEPYPDRFAFSVSMNSFLLADVLIDLGLGGSGDVQLHSDCTGQLH